MVMAATLSEHRGLCPAGTVDRLVRLLHALDLPSTLPGHVATSALLDAMGLDKKAVAGGLRLILLHDAGTAIIDADSSERDVAAAIDACR